MEWVGYLIIGGIVGWLVGLVMGHGQTQDKIDKLERRIDHLSHAIDCDFTEIANVHYTLLSGGDELSKIDGFRNLDVVGWANARQNARWRSRGEESGYQWPRPGF